MKTEQKDDFCELPTVGPSKEQILNNKGYLTYEDLSCKHPVVLNQECDIVLASATQIISSALDKLDRGCPNCKSDTIEPAWSSADISPVSSSSEVMCTECVWDGLLEDTLEVEKKTRVAQEAV